MKIRERLRSADPGPPSAPRKNVGLIIPAHNRKPTTIKCLDYLAESGVLAWTDVIVVDDGSSDGTARAIAEKHPTVIVLEGDGNLWWAGGINLGMKYCHDNSYDFFFWLNDDCRPKSGVLKLMITHCEETGGICTARSVTPSGYSYGGFVKTFWGLTRIDDGACDTFGGNCVCFPISVIDRVGYLDSRRFPMDPADADYGLRAKKLGYRLNAPKGALCENDDNLSAGKKSWLFSDVPAREYLNNFLKNKHHISYIPTYVGFHVRHWGVIGLLNAIVFYTRFLIFMMIRWILPRPILMKMAGRSAAWKKEAHYH